MSGLHTTCWLVSRKLSELAGPWPGPAVAEIDDGEYFCRVVAASTGVVFVPAAKSYWCGGGQHRELYATAAKVQWLPCAPLLGIHAPGALRS